MTSVVRETKAAIDLNKVPGRIDLYEQLIASSEPMFDLDGKSLEKIIKEHAQNLMFYDTTLQECKTIEAVIHGRMEEIEAQLYQKFSTNRQRIMNATEIKQVIKGDPAYVGILEIFLEVQHTKRKLEAVVEAMKSMGWSLNNIVKLRVSQLEHVTL